MTRCSFCKQYAKVTDWKPDKGLDPYMYEYKCNCGRIRYFEPGANKNNVQGIKVVKTNR